jgi:hypothetical protein
MMSDIDELIDKLAQDTAVVKPAPHPFALSAKWMLVAVAYIAISLMVAGVRHDLAIKLHEPWFAVEMLALFGIFFATSVSSALLSFPDIHQMRRAAFAPAISFALFVLAILLAWQADSPPAPLPIHSFECTSMILMLSLLPAVWTIIQMRKYASTHYQWAGSIALLFAFSVGAIWLRLNELNDSIVHVIEWHYLPMIVVGLLGMWLGKIVLKW